LAFLFGYSTAWGITSYLHLLQGFSSFNIAMLATCDAMLPAIAGGWLAVTELRDKSN